jgi:hypothetical protein
MFFGFIQESMDSGHVYLCLSSTMLHIQNKHSMHLEWNLKALKIWMFHNHLMLECL